MSSTVLAEQFRAVAELQGAVAWIVDCATGLPSYISPGVEALLGYSPSYFHQQLAGDRPDGPLAALCSGLPERLRRLAEDGDRTRLRLRREFDIVRPDGRVVPVEVVSSLMLDDRGKPHSAVGVIRNLAGQREFQAEQRRFASMLNHEFRTPLSTIDGAVQLLQMTGGATSEAARQRYRKIADAVDRMIGMLDEYLSPDRLATTGHKHKEHHADPRRLLQEAAAVARAAGRGVTVDAGELPSAIRCAPEGLRLALKVVIDNALRYASGPIDVWGGQDSGGIVILVRDSGDGIPPDEVAKIFDRGYRGSNAAGRPGSGLGLYMARSVLEVQGGSIRAGNRSEGGAEFRIWLPARDVPGK